MELFLKLWFFNLAFCQKRFLYCEQVTSLSAWKIDIAFNISCTKYANFNVHSSLLFNKSGPVVKNRYNNENRAFRQFAKLDRTPNLEFDHIDLKIEIELENDAGIEISYPDNALSLNVSYLHIGEMTFRMKKKWPDEDLKFIALGRSKILRIIDIDFGTKFKRSKYSDCYHDQEYYSHDQVMVPRFCEKDILFCKCFDGITSQYCELLPKNCSLLDSNFQNGHATLTVAEKRRICEWSMDTCCPMVNCPGRAPVIYCCAIRIASWHVTVLVAFLILFT